MAVTDTFNQLNEGNYLFGGKIRRAIDKLHAFRDDESHNLAQLRSGQNTQLTMRLLAQKKQFRYAMKY